MADTTIYPNLTLAYLINYEELLETAEANVLF